MTRDLLSFEDVSADELRGLLERAGAHKRARAAGEPLRTLPGRVVALVLEKASTRTRVSFEVGVHELGGLPVYLASQGTQIGRGEPVEDLARVLDGYCHAAVFRTFGQERCAAMAAAARMPVINGLTDLLHPCQIVADLFTVLEVRGTIDGLRYAWIGDGNNMANSWIEAAGLLGLDLALACPPGYRSDAGVLARARARMAASGRGHIELCDTPLAAARGAHVINTDVWASMGQEEEAEARRRAFAGWCVDAALMDAADPDAFALHCLPAHRGEEIAAEVIDGPRAQVWRQAENRLHVQKAILELCLA
ncbi:MAG TPA: ornithine carbamoyltransferase [Kofleriaceae bacterium]|nr:ornithine carbamoyltransferase [Kofleriaceae bacterium]